MLTDRPAPVVRKPLRRLGGLLGLALLLVLLQALGSAPASAAGLSEDDREHYKNAFIHFDRGNYRDARLHAARAKEKLPAKVVTWLDLTRSTSDADFAELAAFIEENPTWPRQANLARNAERAMPWQLPDKEILAWFESHPPRTADGVMKYGGALIRAGREGEAHTLLRKAWREESFDREQESNFHARYKEILTEADHQARLDNLLWRQWAEQARRQAKRVSKGQAALAEARIRLFLGEAGVDSAIDRVPSSLRDDPGLIYDRAAWRQRKGRYEDVLELLLPLKGEGLPHPEKWWDLRRWAAYEALDRNDEATAYRLMHSHGVEEGSDFAEAEWLAGWTAFAALTDADKAYRHFSRLYYGSTSPISQGRGGFWSARAAKRLGNEDWTRRWYAAAAEQGTSFYGQLAASEAGLPIVIDFEASVEPSDAERAEFARSELARAADLMGELRQPLTQGTLLYHLGDRAETPLEYALAAGFAMEQGRADIAVWTAKRARDAGLLLPDLLFPIPFMPPTRVGEATLDPALVLAIIRQESVFNPEAESHAGAKGLMQLMPNTAKIMAKALGLAYSENRLTRDPAYNMRLGTGYLAGLLEKYDGNAIMALAAYNAGPHRVSRWVEAHGDPRDPKVDNVEWIERIPFSETRNYVMRVLESQVVYRRRLGADIAELPHNASASGVQ